ncbi:MAG: sigma-54-dependent Fis family transcriptional regulator [candidate division Zixibacteria bacterium]|nr:sigma-54-dependent Fis family transcriptional regulator [candidate division Zixibacteria bacterium]
MKNKSILIVDDEAFMRKNIIDLLSSKGCRLSEAADGDEAIEKVSSSKPDLVLLDINLPKTDGLTALGEIKRILPDLPVIVFTAYGTSERAIKAMKAGAYDYIEKPFELDQFLLIIQRALEFSELLGEVKELRNKVSTISGDDDVHIIGSSSQMKEIFKLIGRVAPSDATVLIRGESGTGKELIADAIQRHSLRKKEAYVKVNCGGLSDSILESEIFGHEKGAFTGAIAQRQGRFELADGGTIFLDEIDTMSPSLQVRLLRVLEQQTFYRVGGEDPIHVDIRVIAATNSDLEKEVKEGRFREDLFYRLNVVRINIPPLSQRKEDIPILVKYFLQKYCPDRRLVVPYSEMEKLLSYTWPGNVRELENTIQSATVMARENIISIGSLPIASKGERFEIAVEQQLESGKSLRDILARIEKDLILHALRKNNWNRTEAAKYLQIHRRLLYTKILEFGIQQPQMMDIDIDD